MKPYNTIFRYIASNKSILSPFFYSILVYLLSSCSSMMTPIGIDSKNNTDNTSSSASTALLLKDNNVDQDEVLKAFRKTLSWSTTRIIEILRDLIFYKKIHQKILNGEYCIMYGESWHDHSYEKEVAKHYVDAPSSIRLPLLGHICRYLNKSQFDHLFAHLSDLVPDIGEQDRYKILSELFFDANKAGYVHLVDILYNNVDQNGRNKLLNRFIESLKSQGKNEGFNTLQSLVFDSKIDKSILNKEKTLPDNNQIQVDIASKVRLFLLDGVCNVIREYFKELLSVLYNSNSTTALDKYNEVLSTLLSDAKKDGYPYLATTLFNELEKKIKGKNVFRLKELSGKELSGKELLQQFLELLNEENKKETRKYIDILKDLVINSKLPSEIYSNQDVPPTVKLFLLNGVCNVTPVYFNQLLSDLYSPNSTIPSDKCDHILSTLLFTATKQAYAHVVTVLLNHATIDHTKQDKQGKTAAMYGLESPDEAIVRAYLNFIFRNNSHNKYFKPVDEKGKNLFCYFIDLANKTNGYRILESVNISYNSSAFNFDPEYINSICEEGITPLVYLAEVIEDDEIYSQLANNWQKNSADIILALFLSVESGQASNIVLPRLIQAGLDGLHKGSKLGHKGYDIISFLLNCRYRGHHSNKNALFSKIKGRIDGCERKIYDELSEQSKTQLHIDQLRKKIPELLDPLEEQAKNTNCINELAEWFSLLFKKYAKECDEKANNRYFIEGIKKKDMSKLKELIAKYFTEERYAQPFK